MFGLFNRVGCLTDLVPRWYQSEAAEAGLNAIQDSACHPVIVLPTGAGKSLTLALIIEKFLMDNPGKVVLVLSHVKEILVQNRRTLENHLGPIVGTYSAGLREKNLKRLVTVGGVQSIYGVKSDEFFKKVGLVIVDECHLVNHRNKGRYRKVLDRCHCNILGLTATPYRTGHGYIFIGDDVLFNDLAFDAGDFENYNRLVDEGFLSKLIAKTTDMKMETDGLRITGGDFNQQDLADNFDRDEITNAAIQEVVNFGKKYKKWLLFAIDISHAEHIRAELERNGIPTCVVHSRMEDDRESVLADFHRGKYRAAVNVDILTTGFDEPEIDLIIMLRPTMSPIIHVQTAGRGARPAPGKEHCLFLDFAGNTARLGPINDIKIVQKGTRKAGGGAPITKTCPDCGCIFHPSVRVCDGCGHEFQFEQKIKTEAADLAIVREALPDHGAGPIMKQWCDVAKVKYSIVQKEGNTDMLRVQYSCGLNTFSEWVAYGRKNFAGKIAKNWVEWRWPKNELPPRNVAELYSCRGFLREPRRIFVDSSGKFPDIKDAEF